MALRYFLHVLALATAFLSCTTSAIKLHLQNNLYEPFKYYYHYGSGSSPIMTLRSGESDSISMPSDMGALVMYKGNELRPLKLQYNKDGDSISYVLNGISGDPFVSYRRAVIPSNEECPKIQCRKGSRKCELTKQRPNRPSFHCEEGTATLTVRIG